jgi:sporulation-control protein
MLLRKFMSLIGIGSPQIDLILEKEIYKPGEQVKGYFLIKGGTIVQQLKRIECELVMVDGEKEEIVDYTTILSTECIESEETKKIPFNFLLPDSVLLSTSTRSYRFKTRLVFEQGVASLDHDAIQIIQK